MQAVFSSLMAAWIFVLAVSGWCCRPPSFWRLGESSEVVSLAAECCQHCCQQGHREDEPTAPCKDRKECHGTCTYVPVQKTSFEAKAALTPFDFTAMIPMLGGSQVATALSWERADDPGRFEPPIRLHLYHQVLPI